MDRLIGLPTEGKGFDDEGGSQGHRDGGRKNNPNPKVAIYNFYQNYMDSPWEESNDNLKDVEWSRISSEFTNVGFLIYRK